MRAYKIIYQSKLHWNRLDYIFSICYSFLFLCMVQTSTSVFGFDSFCCCCNHLNSHGLFTLDTAKRCHTPWQKCNRDNCFKWLVFDVRYQTQQTIMPWICLCYGFFIWKCTGWWNWFVLRIRRHNLIMIERLWFCAYNYIERGFRSCPYKTCAFSHSTDWEFDKILDKRTHHMIYESIFLDGKLCLIINLLISG